MASRAGAGPWGKSKSCWRPPAPGTCPLWRSCCRGSASARASVPAVAAALAPRGAAVAAGAAAAVVGGTPSPAFSGEYPPGVWLAGPRAADDALADADCGEPVLGGRAAGGVSRCLASASRCGSPWVGPPPSQGSRVPGGVLAAGPVLVSIARGTVPGCLQPEEPLRRLL